MHFRLARSWLAYAALPMAGLITAPILARALGPDGRGHLAAALQPLTVASAIAAFGLPTAVTYFIGRGYSRRQVLRTTGVLAVVSTLIVGTVLAAYAPAVQNATAFPLVALLAVWTSFIPSAFIAMRRAEHQASRQYFAIDIERVLAALFRVGLIAGLYATAVDSAIVYTVAYQIAGLSASLVLILPSRNKVHPDKEGAVGYLLVGRYAALASVGTVAVALNSRLDQAILPAAMSARQLGLYSVAVTVAEVPSIIAAVSVRNLLAESSHRGTAAVVRKMFIQGLGATTIVCIALACFVPVLVPLFFGRAFEEAVPAVQILLGSTIIAYCVETSSAIIAGAGTPGRAAIGPAIGAIVTVVFIATLWAIQSAIVASLISLGSQVVALAAALYMLKRGARHAKFAF